MKKLIISLSDFLLACSYGTANASELSCPAGQVAQNVLVTAGTDGTPAVTHTETITVTDSPAYQSCDYVGFLNGDYKNSTCTQQGQWWERVYKKVNHPAVTHTETITVIDTPAVPGTDAVYEMQCVSDVNYTPPPVVKNDGGVIPFSVQDRTEICYGHLGKFHDACMNQWKESNPELFTNGVLCELAPQSNLWIVDHTIPVPTPICKEPVLGASIQSQLITSMQKLVSLLQQLIALR